MTDMLSLDLHLHSCYSEDGGGTPEELMAILRQRGLHGMAITDHNTLEGSLKAKASAPKDFIVIPAVEVSTADGHLLAFNVTEAVPRGRSVEETVELVVDRAGVPVVPHVLRQFSGIQVEKLPAVASKISALEVFNGCSLPRTNLKAARLALAHHLGGTGGSDAHEPTYAGFGYTTVDTTDTRADEIVTEILKKRTWGGGKTVPLEYRSDRMALSIRQFFNRGFRRI